MTTIYYHEIDDYYEVQAGSVTRRFPALETATQWAWDVTANGDRIQLNDVYDDQWEWFVKRLGELAEEQRQLDQLARVMYGDNRRRSLVTGQYKPGGANY